MKHVVMSLQFAGVLLPIAKGAEDRDVVPLKPISDVFGLDWVTQHRKTRKKKGSAYGKGPMQTPDFGADLPTRFGICTASVSSGDQLREMVCIRLDRVAAFLNTINPAQVRAGGNVKGAEFLEQKQAEWDDLLHEYEMAGGIFSRSEQSAAMAKIASIRTFIAVCKEKRSTSLKADQDALNELSSRLAIDLGISYQLDLKSRTAA